MKKIYKYGTGDEIPEGAIYLTTKVQKQLEVAVAGYDGSGHIDSRYDYTKYKNCWLVWHYFLVEIED